MMQRTGNENAAKMLGFIVINYTQVTIIQTLLQDDHFTVIH